VIHYMILRYIHLRSLTTFGKGFHQDKDAQYIVRIIIEMASRYATEGLIP
jgi:hypothetical protein